MKSALLRLNMALICVYHVYSEVGELLLVYDILEYLASGMSEEQIINDFPELEKDDIRTVLLLAADRERKLATFDT